MSMSGMLRQLDESQLTQFLDNPDDVLDFLDKEVPASEELDLNKAWHGLHFLLTGEAWGGEEPACYLLAAGEQIGDEEEHDVGYGPARGLHVPQVKAFAGALAAVTKQELASRYNGQQMMELELYPRGWEEEPDEMRDWLAASFDELRQFVRQAAMEDSALLVWLQ
jgi:hypothetical protein